MVVTSSFGSTQFSHLTWLFPQAVCKQCCLVQAYLAVLWCCCSTSWLSKQEINDFLLKAYIYTMPSTIYRLSLSNRTNSPHSCHYNTSSNYRPISILSIVSKLLERHVHTVVSNFLAVNAPISPCQWGFMPHWSATSQLLTTGPSIFFDLRKAFDSVPHLHLLDKLAAFHLDPRIITWLHSYLMGRSQLVLVGGQQSTSLPVISGVPQGSVLGPLLFLIYINDVATRICRTAESPCLLMTWLYIVPFMSQLTTQYFRMMLQLFLSGWMTTRLYTLENVA